VYAALGLVLFVLAVAAVWCKPHFDFVVSDARGYYVYLPSLVLDGDLDFRNQVAHHWGGAWHHPLEERFTERGLIKNRYPVGVALTLAPSFLFGHAIACAAHALTGADWCAADGYSVPYQLANLLWLLALGVGCMILTDDLLRAFGMAALPTLLGVVTVWVGTPLLYYTFREPFMAHAPGLCWVTACVWLVWRLRQDVADGQLHGWRLFLLAFCTSMALVCRPTNAVLFPFHLYLLHAVLRAGLLGRLLRRLGLCCLGLLPLAAQALAWHELHGRFLVYSYDGLRFQWAHPVLWQTLFSSRHGLVFWSPLTLLALVGVGWRLCRRGPGAPLLACFVLSWLLLWYANSCWPCWWFGDSFGGRAFLELSALLALGLATLFEGLLRAGPRVRRLCSVSCLVLLLYHFALMGLYILHRIPRGDYLF
jgi:hypothetical protein